MAALSIRGIEIPRSLQLFWAAVLAILIIGIAWLAYLGPIKQTPHYVARTKTSGIPAVTPLLLTASSLNPEWKIPHPGPYGVTPMRYYAATSPAAHGHPRIAIMIGGIGYALAPSMDAVKDLPPQISLAFSPYGDHIQAIATAARAAGHETIIGLPMQVGHNPDITAGDKALHAASAPAHNHARLDWALSRLTGYAGVTDVIGLDAPETFLAHKRAATWLAAHLAHDGLFMVVASQNAAPPADANIRIANSVINPAQGRAAMAAALKQLETIAQSRGSALGVVLNPTRRSIAQLARWASALNGKGITLVPVSALAAPDAPP